MNFDYVVSLSSKEDNLEVGVSYDRIVAVYADLFSAIAQNCIFNKFYQVRVSVVSNVADKSSITKISSFKVIRRFQSYEIFNLIDDSYKSIPELTDPVELELYDDYTHLLKDKVLAQLKRHDINISYDELSKRLMISDDDYYRWIELIQILRLLPENASKDYVMSKLLDFVIVNHADNIKSIKHDAELYAIRLNSEVHII